MAARKKQTKKMGGPFLAAAFFCEKIIEDKLDGALTAVRITDQVNVWLAPSAPPDVPSKKRRIPVTATGLVSFKTGGSPGTHTIRIVIVSPSGKKHVALEQSLPFTPLPHGGANLRFESVMNVSTGGLFLFHVYLDGKRAASMPLQITIQRSEPQ